MNQTFPVTSTPDAIPIGITMEDIEKEVSRIEKELTFYAKEAAKAKGKAAEESRYAEQVRRTIAEERQAHYEQVEDLEQCRTVLREEIQQAEEYLGQVKREAEKMKKGLPAPLIPLPEAADVNTAVPSWPEPITTATTRNASPARVPAVQPMPFTGKEPWPKWFQRFQEDMEYNSWDPTQRLHAMKRALRDGPGEAALTLFLQTGGSTYEELVVLAGQTCEQISQDDSLYLFKTRKQKRDETLRIYAMELKRIAMEVYTTVPLDTPWLREELNQRFLQGIYDTELQATIYAGWRPHMTLTELCELGEHYMKKRLYVPLASNPLAAVGEEKVAEPSKEERGRAVSTKEVEDIVKRILGNWRPRKKIARADSVCYRCQEKGHFARECKSLVPVDGTPLLDLGTGN